MACLRSRCARVGRGAGAGQPGGTSDGNALCSVLATQAVRRTRPHPGAGSPTRVPACSRGCRGSRTSICRATNSARRCSASCAHAGRRSSTTREIHGGPKVPARLAKPVARCRTGDVGQDARCSRIRLNQSTLPPSCGGAGSSSCSRRANQRTSRTERPDPNDTRSSTKRRAP